MRFLYAIACLLVLSGCAGYVQTNSTTFHGDGHALRDTISVRPIDKSQEGSLEFKAVSNYLLKKFSESGYLPTSNPQSKYVAYITYGIDSGTTRVTSVPIFGQTGGGTTYTSGTINSGTQSSSFSGTSTTMPTYGLVGSMASSSREYKRAVNIDIFRIEPSKAPEKVYELRGTSSGSCGNINSVIFSIIDGMFKNFPGESGKTKRGNVLWDGSC
jgi:hypothetical protein